VVCRCVRSRNLVIEKALAHAGGGGCCAKLKKLNKFVFYRYNCLLFYIYGHHPFVFTNKQGAFVQLNTTQVY